MRNEKFLAKTRIRDSFWGFRRVESSITRFLIVNASFEPPSSVMLRSLEHVPTSRWQVDGDTLESIRLASTGRV